MTKLDNIIQIKEETLDIQSKLISSDVEEVMAAMKKYEQLVDWFYHESGDFMAPKQYEAAKKDLEYFIFLMELAEAYHQTNICEKET